MITNDDDDKYDDDKEDDDDHDVGESDIREEQQAWWLEFKVTRCSRRKARQLLIILW